MIEIRLEASAKNDNIRLKPIRDQFLFLQLKQEAIQNDKILIINVKGLKSIILNVWQKRN